MYPLDVVKTQAQLLHGTKGQQSVLKALTSLIRERGFGTYRGILPPIFVEAPKRAVKFASNEVYMSYLPNTLPGKVAAGALTGMTEGIIIVPFELVKIRLQAKGSSTAYKNTFDAIFKILKNEGPLAFFKGLEPTLVRNGLWNAAYFGVIPFIKSLLPSTTPNSNKQVAFDFLAGTAGGTVATMINTPPDVIKSRIQNNPQGNQLKYKWTLGGIKVVAQEEGLRALYKGFIPKVLRLGPGGGVMLVVFRYMTGIWEDLNRSRWEKTQK